MSLLTDLREFNIIRDAEWDTSDNGLDGSFFGNELAGEVGEAIEVAQEMLFGDAAMNLVDDLAEELADVLICIDLLAIKFNIVLNIEALPTTPVDPVQELLNLARFMGRVCNITKKLERERLGLVGSRATRFELAAELVSLSDSVFLLAAEFGIRLDVAVPAKFNKTSDKCGLTTKMVVPA